MTPPLPDPLGLALRLGVTGEFAWATLACGDLTLPMQSARMAAASGVGPDPKFPVIRLPKAE